MTVYELKAELDKNPNLVLIDVREEYEFNICKIPNSFHLPMSIFSSIFGNLPKDKELVVLCHHGMRSLMVINFLKQHNYTNVINLEGGIDQWAAVIDKTMNRY